MLRTFLHFCIYIHHTRPHPTTKRGRPGDRDGGRQTELPSLALCLSLCVVGKGKVVDMSNLAAVSDMNGRLWFVYCRGNVLITLQLGRGAPQRVPTALQALPVLTAPLSEDTLLSSMPMMSFVQPPLCEWVAEEARAEEEVISGQVS